MSQKYCQYCQEPFKTNLGPRQKEFHVKYCKKFHKVLEKQISIWLCKICQNQFSLQVEAFVHLMKTHFHYKNGNYENKLEVKPEIKNESKIPVIKKEHLGYKASHGQSKSNMDNFGQSEGISDQYQGFFQASKNLSDEKSLKISEKFSNVSEKCSELSENSLELFDQSSKLPEKSQKLFKTNNTNVESTETEPISDSDKEFLLETEQKMLKIFDEFKVLLNPKPPENKIPKLSFIQKVKLKMKQKADQEHLNRKSSLRSSNKSKSKVEKSEKSQKSSEFCQFCGKLLKTDFDTHRKSCFQFILNIDFLNQKCNICIFQPFIHHTIE